MIIFGTLLTIAIVLTITSALVIGAGGAAFLLVFGDVIVCILILVWIIKRIFKKKDK